MRTLWGYRDFRLLGKNYRWHIQDWQAMTACGFAAAGIGAVVVAVVGVCRCVIGG